MGQEILYCSRCQTRIVGGDFERGEAYRVGEQVACGKCGLELLSKAPLDVQKQILEQKQKAIQNKEQKGAPAKPPRVPTGSSTQVRSNSGEPQPSRAMIGILIGVGITLVILVGMLVMSSSPPAPAPVSRPPSPPPPAPAPPPGPSPREIAAQGAFQVAAAFAKDHPADLDEQAKLFEKIATEFEGTPACLDARRELERIAQKRREAEAERSAQLAREQELAAAKAASPAQPPALQPKANGNLLLRVAEATVVGSKIKRIGEGDWSLLQTWNDTRDYVEWTVVVPQAGTYTLKCNYACPKEHLGKPYGGEFSFMVGEQAQRFTVEPTKTWGDFTTVSYGTVPLPAGTSKITVRPVKVINNLMSLRFVQLVPLK
jgi:hypothetical protein